MIVREISTVALSTEAAMRFEQSWGLFCRSHRGIAGEGVMSASWAAAVLEGSKEDKIDKLLETDESTPVLDIR